MFSPEILNILNKSEMKIFSKDDINDVLQMDLLTEE